MPRGTLEKDVRNARASEGETLTDRAKWAAVYARARRLALKKIWKGNGGKGGCVASFESARERKKPIGAG